MPRPKSTAVAVPDNRPNSTIASAARVQGKRNLPRGQVGTQDWQAEAWKMFDQVGELAASAQWIGNALSRVTLNVKQDTPAGRIEVKAGEPLATLAALYNGPTGQSQMLSAFGLHFTIPGEAWLVGVPADPEQGRMKDWWRVLSNTEVKKVGDRWEIERGDGQPEKYKAGEREGEDAEAFVLRIWRSHPAKWVEATSPVRAALPILRELVGLTQHVAANIDSRLAGAGLLLLPSEMTFDSPAADDEPTGDGETDEFVSEFIDNMMTAIGDRGSASAVVPIVVKAPGAVLGNVQHIKFSSDLDAEARELRNEAIRRLALALDIPPEVLLGVADVNHWNAWLVTEEAIKIHIEPLVELITSALTVEYLWPSLQQMNVENPQSYVIEGDTSALRQRPSHSTEAQALHKDLLITDAALLRETGFDDSDLLDPASDEYKRRLTQATASGVTTADLTAAALAMLGVNLQPKPSEVVETPPADGTALPAPAAPAPPAIEAPREPPTGLAAAGRVPIPDDAVIIQGLPRTPQAVAVIVGGELLCKRAMERANNRLNSRRRTPMGPVDPTALTAALADAWGDVERAAALCGVEAVAMQAACDGYVRDRLITGAAHDPMVLVDHLRPLIPGASAA